MPEYKTCTHCGISKAVRDFARHRHKNGSVYLQSWCRICTSAQTKSRGYGRKSALLARYGLSMAQYESILAVQSGCCAICLKSVDVINGKARHFSVDHNHTTGKVRGILCNNCNLGIGALGDRLELLQRAVVYLETH